MTADTVTVRERDTCAQTRVAVAQLEGYLAEHIGE
jgi:glycyl-tRNA synthetase (class II)